MLNKNINVAAGLAETPKTQKGTKNLNFKF